MVEVQWSIKATKQVLKLETSDKAAVYEAVEGLKEFPYLQNVKKLTGHEYQYRLRVGNFRVLFDFDGMARIVSIEEVRKRDKNTY